MALLKPTLVLAALHVASIAEGLHVDIGSHLKHLATHRYPNEAQKGAREQVTEYIARQFEECGLIVHLQRLKGFAAPTPGDTLDYSHYSKRKTQVYGVNIIGISGSVLEEAGAVVVVGAAYDTDGVGSPLWDNGAGVAVLLETARLYQATVISPRLTTLFVAFDLSSDRYGSKLFPAAYEEVAARKHRGDFVASVFRGVSEAERTLARQVMDSYEEVGGRLIEFRLGNHSHTLLPSSLPAREAAYFWQSTFQGHKSPLPAILLTDTETNRAWPRDAASPTQLTEAQMDFLDTTVASLVHFLVRRQPAEAMEGEWREVGLLTALMVSCGINLLLLVHLHHLCTSPTASKRERDSHSPSETLSLQDMKCSVSDGRSSFTTS